MRYKRIVLFMLVDCVIKVDTVKILIKLLQLLVCDEENDVPGTHSHPGGNETFVQCSQSFVANRLYQTVHTAGVISMHLG